MFWALFSQNCNGQNVQLPLIDACRENRASCPFCNSDIIQKQSVFESEHLCVLLDYAPRVLGHLLVIPKRHVFKAHEMSDDEWAELSLVISKIVMVYSEYLETNEYIIMEKNGPRAFQEVPHVHFHLLPIHSETWDGVWHYRPKILDPNELQQQVELFRYYFQIRTTYSEGASKVGFIADPRDERGIHIFAPCEGVS